MAKGTNELNTEELIAVTDKLYKEKKYQEIIDLLTDDILEQHTSVELYTNRAKGYWKLNQMELGLEDCEKAIMLNPKYAPAYNYRGNIWSNKGEYDKAIQDYNTAIELDSKFTNAYNNRGNVWDQKGEYDKAIQDYNTAIELDSKYANAYYNRGNVWDQKEEYDKAIQDYNTAIELDSKYANAYYNRGNAWDQKGEYDKAIQDYNNAIEIDAKNVDIYYDRGVAWHKKGEYDKAIQDYSTVIELDSKNANAYYNRGNAWDEKGEYDKAIQNYNAAIELDSKYADAYHNRGVVWHKKGEYDKAIQDYNNAIELDSRDVDAYYNRGTAWHQKGEYDKAIQDYEKANEIEPNISSYWLNKAKEKRDEQLALTKQPIERDDSNTNAPIQLFLRILDNANISDLDTRIIMQIAVEAKRDAIDKVRKHAAENIDEIIPDKLVAHYTKLKVADIIISAKEEKSYHRYYNAVYMNDPEEGRILLQYMDEDIRKSFEEASKEEEDNIYIGSFLPASSNESGHEDELVMWRTYGKDEVQNEAAGCSIVLDRDFFDTFDGDGKNAAINPDMLGDKLKSSSSQCLYRVLYYDKRQTGEEFECMYKNGSELKNDVDNLKMYLHKLIQQKDTHAYTNKNKAIDKIIYHLISEVRYFFKSADYSFENEVRVIQFATKESELLEIDESSTPKRVYLNSNNNVQPFIRKIILGPKVPNPKQWLYLEVAMKQKKDVKKEGYTISVIRSERKYQ